MYTVKDTYLKQVDYLTKKDVDLILNHSRYSNLAIESYTVTNASNQMLGFLCDHWRLKVVVIERSQRKTLSFFVKAVSRINEAKANMVKEMDLYDKELIFYSDYMQDLDLPGLKPWCAKIVTALNDAMVFEDLNDLQYKLRSKFDRFDVAHTLQALQMLARFHASSIIHEERQRKELELSYSILDKYEKMLHKGGYRMSDPWYIQCINGGLEAVKSYSKYSNDHQLMNVIETRWVDVWSSALDLSDPSAEYRNVICHCDLWNNNILFHYNEENNEPDNCVLVDFQATRYQPPAGDVMLLLCCNLDPTFREKNMKLFLSCYYQELRTILKSHVIDVGDILTEEMFLKSAEEQRKCGLIFCACLMPLFWLDDDATVNNFSDSDQFYEILTKDKATFIKKVMSTNTDYKDKVMEILDEIVDRYCLQ